MKTDWITAVSIRLGPLQEVALRFTRPCPDDFLLAAMLGIDLGYFGEDEIYQIGDLVHVTPDGAVNITQRLPGRSLIESLY